MRHSRDHYAILFGTLIIALTLFLILDIQSGRNLRAPYLQIPENYIEPTKNSIENDLTPTEIVNNINYRYEDENESVDNGDTFTKLKRNIGFQ